MLDSTGSSYSQRFFVFFFKGENTIRASTWPADESPLFRSSFGGVASTELIF